MSPWMEMAYDAGYRGEEQEQYARMLEEEAWQDYQRSLDEAERDEAEDF